MIICHDYFSVITAGKKLRGSQQSNQYWLYCLGVGGCCAGLGSPEERCYPLEEKIQNDSHFDQPNKQYDFRYAFSSHALVSLGELERRCSKRNFIVMPLKIYLKNISIQLIEHFTQVRLLCPVNAMLLQLCAGSHDAVPGS